MTSPIVSVEIGRSTWQGFAENAPLRAVPITMTYRNYRGEVDNRTVLPIRVWFGSTDWHPEPGWLLSAYDLAKDAHRDFALADCQFANLCASGQQVRAVEMLGELLAYEEWQAHVGGVVPDRFLGVINRAIEAYRAALTPAPQPEGQDEVQCDTCAGNGEIVTDWDGYLHPPEGAPADHAVADCPDCAGSGWTPAPNAAQTEAVPVAWRCKDYADDWIIYGNKAPAELYQAYTGCLMEPLYAHPAAPAPGIAEAIEACRIIDAAVKEGHDNASDLILHLLSAAEPARAALRALEGRDDG